MTTQERLIHAIKRRGFNIDDCPYTPIRPQWEGFPIVKAIRDAERETGLKYLMPVTSYVEFDALTDTLAVHVLDDQAPDIDDIEPVN